MRIGAVVRMLREQRGMTLAALADQVDGYDAGNLSRYERGLQDIDSTKLAKIAEVLGTTVGKLYLLAELPGAATSDSAAVSESSGAYGKYHDIDQSIGFDLWDDSTPLRDDEIAAPFFMEVEMAAGSGSELRVETSGPKLRFSKRTLRKAGVTPENAVCAVVNGDSMEPVIPNRQVVGIDTGVSRIVTDGDIYAVDHGGLLRVKRLFRMPGGKVKINSYNPEYQDEVASDAEITILGRVFWWSVLR